MVSLLRNRVVSRGVLARRSRAGAGQRLGAIDLAGQGDTPIQHTHAAPFPDATEGVCYARDYLGRAR